MSRSSDPLPTSIEDLRALLLAERSAHAAEREQARVEIDRLAAARDLAQGEIDRLASARDLAENEIGRLQLIIKALQRHNFGRRSETLDADQLALALEDVEQSIAAAEQATKDQAPEKDEAATRRAKRRSQRGALPAHLPREERIIDIADKTCPCCGGALHKIGEDVAERLDVIPARFKVLVVRRPKYACRSCEGAVMQAPAPERLIEGGLPTEALVAHVVVGKYADHLPLYRQAQIYARQGMPLDRSTLADWVGRAAFILGPVHEHLLAELKRSAKLFADETVAPVLDPGRRRTKKGQLWAYARDDRPWTGSDPPGVAYVYAPDRTAERPAAHLAGFTGVLQVDGYAGYRTLAEKGKVALAFCWSHVRRRFYEINAASPAPVAAEALARIGALYKIETEIRGQPADERRRVRQARALPIVAALRPWLTAELEHVSRKSAMANAIRYVLTRWEGLARFLDDGRIELDSNIVERAIRPIALGRKNHLFAGSDGGGAHWAILASLIETAKMNGIDPEAYLADILARLVNRHPMSRIDELLPWAYAAKPELAAVA